MPLSARTAAAGRRWLRRSAAAALVAGLASAVVWTLDAFTTFERHDYSLPIEPWTPKHEALRAAVTQTVEALANGVGARNLTRYPDGLAKAERYVADRFEAMGLAPERQLVANPDGPSSNVLVRFPPPAANATAGAEAGPPWIVVGAHYDTYRDSPGADDNATGVAALFALAERLRAGVPGRKAGVLLAALTNEEPPYFQTPAMGSYALAASLRAAETPVALMISFDSLGYFALAPRTQTYPSPFHLAFADVADFLAVVGDLRSRTEVGRMLSSLRARTNVPLGALALPPNWEGAGESDQWSFWQHGFRGFAVTDTALYRSPYYHARGDRPETLDYPRFVRIIDALVDAVTDLSREPPGPRLAASASVSPASPRGDGGSP
jgi:Zn-dependent M28 family amino/carboxypeptidase